MYSRVVAVLSRRQLGRYAKLRGTEHPVWIREVVEEAEVFKATISGVKPIPLGFFDIDAQVALRISAPASGVHEKRLEGRAFAVSRPQQEGAVVESRSGFVVQITLVLIEIAIDAQTAVSKLHTPDSRVVAGLFTRFRWRFRGIRFHRRR